MTILNLGTAKIDVTPRWPLPLAGYAHRVGAFENVSQPLHARVLFFEWEEGALSQQALLISADLIWWDEEVTTRLRHRVKQYWNLDDSTIILHATHTHSGPQTSTRFASSLGGADPMYVSSLESAVLEGTKHAHQNLEPVVVERGTSQCHIGVNRRGQVDGQAAMIPNPQGPIDPEVIVLRFQRAMGNTKAVLVHYACHPTTTDENCVSPDFPGLAMQYLEDHLGEGAIAAYLQGCCGDVRPSLVEEGLFFRGSKHDVCRLGGRLADRVINLLEGSMTKLILVPPKGSQTEISLSLEPPPNRTELETFSHDSGVVGEWAELLIREPNRLRQTVSLELTLLELAKGFSILAIGAELVVEYGLFIKQTFGGEVLPLPYSNSMIGYVPTTRQLAEGGYEARESTPYFMLPAAFAPGVERKVRDSIVNIVEGRE